MEKFLEKIKEELENKRKYNLELLKTLKEESIFYKIEKEKQKYYSLKKSSTFLNKKRKLSNSNIIYNNKQNDDNSLDNIYLDEDHNNDDYNEDFMNNSIKTKKPFNNLNFCRPERFSYKNKKKKLSVQKEQQFTIKKISKPKIVSKESNLSFSRSFSKDNAQLGFLSVNKNNIIKDDNTDTNNKNNDINNNIKYDNINFIKKNDNINISQSGNINNMVERIKDEEVAFFNDNNSIHSSMNIPQIINNKEIKTGGLFGQSIPINNETTLFSSNIKDNKDNTKEKGNELKDEKKGAINLFGNIDRLNKTEDKDLPTLFGHNIEKEKKLETPKKETAKEKIDISLFDSKPSPKPNEKIVEKNLFNNINDNKDKENLTLFPKEPIKPNIELKEKINLPKLEPITEEKDEITNKNKENNDNNKTLFGDIPFKKEEIYKKKDSNNSLFLDSNLFSGDKKVFEKKEEKNETINTGLFNNINTMNNNNINKNSLFQDNTENKDDIKQQIPSNLTSGSGSLVNDSNPFLKASNALNVKSVFSVDNLNNNNKPNQSIFMTGNNNNSSLFNNNEQKSMLFDNKGFGMNNGDMNFLPKLISKDTFNDNNQNNNNQTLFNSGNQSQTNLFGAPYSLFNNNSGFPTNSGGLFGQGSNLMNGTGGFSLGKSFK